MTNVIDKRVNGKNNSAINRGRFLDRHRQIIKDAVHKQINGKSITDQSGNEISIDSRSMHEPFLGNGKKGVWDRVFPGNTEHQQGDLIRRPQGGKANGKNASNSDDPLEDEFMFTLTKEEFIKYFFEDLELPDLVKKEMADMEALKTRRAGYTSSGVATNMHILKSMKGALGRRIALSKKDEKRLKEAEHEAETEKEQEKLSFLLAEIAILKSKISKVPFLDTFDIRYRNTVAVPAPDNRAVMFCLMDVSGSMGEEEKDIAKRFFIMLYLFLTKAYDKIEIVFLRHHTKAAEVTEHEFFHGRESGGTQVSSVLTLLDNIITERYPQSGWNIYVAQASDGDNYSYDNIQCYELMHDKILPKVQYFAYIEIARTMTQDLFDVYKNISMEFKNLAVRQVIELADVYPVFRDLFKKRGLK